MNWLINACGLKEFKGVDVSRAYKIDAHTAIATDGYRMHVLKMEVPQSLKTAPTKLKEVYKTLSKLEGAGIEHAWELYGGYYYHFFEGASIQKGFLEDVIDDHPEMKCFIEDDLIFFRSHDRAAYIMPFVHRKP